jgi:SAM-dependent methyltransferase
MLYHVSDLDRGLSEIARVLVDGGSLVAVTNSVRHLSELRALIHYEFPGEMFHRENGEEILRAQFADVERFDLDAKVTVRGREKLVAYAASLSVPTEPIPDDLALPFVTYSRVSIFVATK